ncbi:MAG: 1-deoxy-D-xylulose-5-phosphate reductoisomerase, partial [Flexibacteraceae bacterium]
VIVHPQSIIHSMLQFEDGSIKAQMGLPDMKLPIQYALGYPQRIANNFSRFNFVNYPQLTFEQPDKTTFRALQLAFDTLDAGKSAPCILNAANEIAVAAFLADKIGFLQIAEIVEETLNKVENTASTSIAAYVEKDKEARMVATQLINK